MRLGIGMLLFLLMRAFFLLGIVGARHVCGGTEAESVMSESGYMLTATVVLITHWTHATRTRPDASCHAKSRHVCTSYARRWDTGPR